MDGWDAARARERRAWDGLVRRVRADRRLGDAVADALGNLAGADAPPGVHDLLRALEGRSWGR